MKKTLLLISLLSSFLLKAQVNLGVHASNFAGVNGIEFQPASFVDGRFKFDMTLVGLNANLWTNAIYFDTKNMPAWWKKSFVNSQTSDSAILADQYTTNDWLAPKNTFQNRNFFQTFDTNTNVPLGLYQSLQVDLLNFSFQIKSKYSFGLAVRFKEVFNVQNLDPTLAYLAQNSLEVPSLWNKTFNEELLRMNHMSWGEIGLNYGMVLKDDNQHFMKAGTTAKLLTGFTSGYVYTGDLDYGLLNADTSFYIKGKFNYGYNADIDSTINNGFSTDALFRNLGFGIDLGYVYEWRPKYNDYKYEMDNVQGIWRKSKNKYKLRVNAALLDIGGIKFKKGKYTKDMVINETVNFDLNTFDPAEGFTDFDLILDSLSIANPTAWQKDPNTKPTYFMNTPTRLALGVDYHIWKIFYVNASGMVGLNPKKDVAALRVPNQITLTPSLDWSWFGLHLPLSYNRYSGLKQGIATRLGPLTVGYMDIRSLFAFGKIKGTELFVNLRLPILFDEPNDRDDDHVSDKMDECKEIPGVWAFKGCPDTDKDGIPDAADRCPNDAGTSEFQGCPDFDGDKIPDIDDNCDSIPGVKYFQGCPDVDQDSIMDLKDDCPDVKGLAIFNGCPDRDNDGVMDKEDECPDNAGPIANKGCPDTDNDGLYDFVDNCPTEFGPQENQGCPWPDTDKDGLIDKDDECPTLAGPLKNKGCPYVDTDKDGILDKDDDCPTVPGVPENKGCPKIEKVEQEILNTAFEDLEFNTGNAIIKPESYASLDRLAELLIKKKAWKLSISGHTDNQGEDAKNMVLSKNRSEAVKAYLISKGVEADRLKTFWYGESKPIATNDTPEGRQKNRRVEMKVLFE